MRKPGTGLKLMDSWEGPYTVLSKNSPLSYKIDLGDHRLNSVHIQLLKQYQRPKQIKRVTSVLEGDTTNNDITLRYTEANVQDQILTEEQQTQLDEVLAKHTKVLTKQPGLNKRVTFEIDTGDAAPIFQRAYNTPASLKASVDVELDLLLAQGYIRPSSSLWASPMVTVRKPDGSARLCVDFRKINEVTRQTPFYMTRVEEVLEGVGQAKIISKLDLSKGYYQVQMMPNDIAKTAFICHRGVLSLHACPLV